MTIDDAARAPAGEATRAEVLEAIVVLADRWRAERDDRLQRRHLDPADFAALADTGFGRLIVPVEDGGFWTTLNETGPIIVDAIRTLARGDQSVALVASMHPAIVVFWTATVEAPEPHRSAWAEQRSEVFDSVLAGHFWGTLTSEPGSGGDIMATKAVAEPVDGVLGRYRLRGEKHFGSGSEVLSYMITTARPEGMDRPLGFYLDLRRQSWDGTDGLRITNRWDGMGMKATQSHGVMLEGVESTAFAWPASIAAAAPYAASLGLPMFCAVTASIADEAMAEAERRLAGRDLRASDEVDWARAQVEHWMLTQAMAGLLRSLATQDAGAIAVDAVKAKLGLADLAETLLSRICRVVGGGAFSARSPFASWYEDVRALGYLRPPWALAYDQLIEARRSGAAPGFGIESP